MKTVTPEKLRDLRTLLCSARRVAVVSHSHPDGDALGSTTAMLHYLEEKYGAEATVVLPSPYAGFLDFLECPGIVIAEENPSAAQVAIAGADLVICLDFNTFSRTDSLAPMLEASPAPKVLIDHHLNPDMKPFDIVFSEIEISSASELLYWILMALEDSGEASVLPASVALSLMTGMTTDTNNFANSVFPSTFRMASSLLAAGVDRDSILASLYNRYRENRYRALGYVLDELMTITPYGVAYVIIRESDKERFDLKEGETEGFVNMPLGIDRVLLSILLKEDKGHFRVSIRSMKGVSANRLARESFNGGGHECAAGGRLYFPENIPSPDAAAEYIETVTARFMRENAPE